MMEFMTEPALNPAIMVCPHCNEEDNIWIHSQKERRFKCNKCNRTFAESRGTMLFNKRYPNWVILLVLSLLAGGCPVQAIVFAFKINEQTVASWQLAAGQQAEQVQAAKVCSSQLAGEQIQSDEMWVKTQFGPMWLATSMAVFSRLFIWGAVSIERKQSLMDKVVQKVKLSIQRGTAFLWVTDGFGGWEQAIRKQLRTPKYSGKPGRPKLLVWAELQMVQVVKRQQRRCLTGIERRLRIGNWSKAHQLVAKTQTNPGVFNTAYIERLNATFRTWMPTLTRRSRTPSRYRPHLEASMFWTGAIYNFCRVHATLEATPAMAAGLTEEVWTVRDLLFCLQNQPKSIHATL